MLHSGGQLHLSPVHVQCSPHWQLTHLHFGFLHLDIKASFTFYIPHVGIYTFIIYPRGVFVKCFIIKFQNLAQIGYNKQLILIVIKRVI